MTSTGSTEVKVRCHTPALRFVPSLPNALNPVNNGDARNSFGSS